MRSRATLPASRSGVLGGVVGGYAQQHEQPLRDRADDLSVDRDARFRDSLHCDAHR